MKLRFASLSLLALGLMLAPAPAMAQQIVYSNGPTDGNDWAWAINLGAVVSDTFTLANENTSITGADFAMWLFPGDTLTSAQLSITSGPFGGGTSYFNGTVTFTQSNCVVNQYGFSLCNESTSFNGPTLNSGTYWLTLQNGSTPFGNPVYWDENYGPSQALRCCGTSQPVPNAVGTIPSESFTVLGFNEFTTTTGGPGTLPEPSSIMLFGTGILSLANIVRRKLR
jgi:hypothetical protein